MQTTHFTKKSLDSDTVTQQPMPFFKITEKIKQVCHSGQYACGLFLDLQKAFTV